MGIAATKRQKEQAKYKLPNNYHTTPEEQKYYEYCVNHNIIISPIGISQTPGKWYIGISEPGRHKKVYKSKHIYDRDTIWIEFFNMCKYYYDKH